MYTGKLGPSNAHTRQSRPISVSDRIIKARRKAEETVKKQRDFITKGQEALRINTKEQENKNTQLKRQLYSYIDTTPQPEPETKPSSGFDFSEFTKVNPFM